MSNAEPTKAEQMQAIQNAAGECRHEVEWVPGGGRSCKHCDVDIYGKNNTGYFERFPELLKNPDPDDLNALFGYAEKLNINTQITQAVYTGSTLCQAEANGQSSHADTPADALRSALFQSITEG